MYGCTVASIRFLYLSNSFGIDKLDISDNPLPPRYIQTHVLTPYFMINNHINQLEKLPKGEIVFPCVGLESSVSTPKCLYPTSINLCE